MELPPYMVEIRTHTPFVTYSALCSHIHSPPQRSLYSHKYPIQFTSTNQHRTTPNSENYSRFTNSSDKCRRPRISKTHSSPKQIDECRHTCVYVFGGKVFRSLWSGYKVCFYPSLNGSISNANNIFYYCSKYKNKKCPFSAHAEITWINIIFFFFSCSHSFKECPDIYIYVSFSSFFKTWPYLAMAGREREWEWDTLLCESGTHRQHDKEWDNRNMSLRKRRRQRLHPMQNVNVLILSDVNLCSRHAENKSLRVLLLLLRCFTDSVVDSSVVQDNL